LNRCSGEEEERIEMKFFMNKTKPGQIVEARRRKRWTHGRVKGLELRAKLLVIILSERVAIMILFGILLVITKQQNPVILTRFLELLGK